MGVGGENLVGHRGAGDAGLGLWPEGFFADAEEVGDLPAVAGMRHAAGEPTLHGPGMDLGGAGEGLDAHAGVGHRLSQRLIFGHSGI